MPERVGIVGAFDVERFNAGLDTYINGLLRAQQSTESVVNRINGLIDSIKPLPTLSTPTVNVGSGVDTSINSVVNQINQLASVQQDKVSTLISSIANSLSQLSGLGVENALTNLNDLGYTLQQLESFSGKGQNIQKFFTDLSVALSSLAKNNDVATISQVLSTLSYALEGFSNLKGVDPTSLTDAIRQLEQVKPIPQQTLNSLLQLAIVLDELAKVPDLPNLGKTLATLGRGITGIADIKLINAASLDNLIQLGNTLSQFSKIPDVSTSIQSIQKVANALKVLAKFQNIPAGVFDSLIRLSDTLKIISSVGDVSKLGSSISSIARSLNGLQNVKAVPTEALNTVVAVIRTVENLSKISGVDTATKNISSLVRSLNNLATVKIPQGDIFSTLSGLTNILRRLSENTNISGVASSLGGLISGLGRLGKIQPISPAVVTSTQNFLNTITKFAGTNVGGLTALSSILSKLTPQLGGYTRQTNEASSSTSRFSQVLAAGFAGAIAASAISTLQSLTRAIQGLFREAYSLIQFFEGFSLSVQTVVAADMRAADSTLTFADAMERSKAIAFGYQKVLQQLAIKSKFTTQQVAGAFQTAISQSFDPAQALRVTKALVDFTSGRGLDPERLNLIALALGQINSRGKLTGEEIRQLSQSGVAVKRILSEAFNVPLGDLDDLVKKGLIPANSAIEAIIASMEKDFAGAAERTQNTLSGLISSLIDIKELSLSSLFTNTFAPVIPILQEMVGYLSSDQFLATLQVIGEILGNQLAVAINFLRESVSNLIQTFQGLSPETKKTIATFLIVAVVVATIVTAIGALSVVLTALVNPFTVLVGVVSVLVTGWVRGFDQIQSITLAALRTVGDAFGTVGRNAVEWGINIVSSLADGITGAVGLILDALSIVGQAITYLLKPGSPPRLLPELDTWGTGAAEAYLEGWTKVQFGALDDFGNLVAKKIKQGVDLGTITQEDSFKFELFGREQIANAIEQIRQFGQVSQETIQNIAKASGFATDVVDRYLSKYAAVASATNAVTSAQNYLNQVTTKYDTVLKSLQQRLDAISAKEVAAGNADKIKKLQRIVNNGTVSEERRQQALAEIEKLRLEEQIAGVEAQKKEETDFASQQLANVQQILQSAQEQFDLYKAQIDVQLSTVDILAEQKLFYDQLLKTVSSVGDKLKEALSPLEKQLKSIQLQQDELNDLIDLKRQQAILEDKNATAVQKTAAQLKIQEINTRRALRALDAKELGIDLSYLGNIPITLDDISKGAGGASDEISGLAGKFEGLKGIDLEGKLAEFNQIVDDTKDKFTDFGKQFSATIDDIDAKLPRFLSIKENAEGTIPAVQNLTRAFIAFGAIVIGQRIIGSLPFLGSVLRVLVVLFRVLALLLNATVIPAISAMIASLAPLALALAGVGVVIGGLYYIWDNNWFGIQDKTRTSVLFILAELKKLTDSQLYANIGKSLEGLQKTISTSFVGRGYRIIRDFVADIFNAVGVTDVAIKLRNVGTAIFDAIIGGIVGYFTSGLPEPVKTNLDIFMRLIKMYLGISETESSKTKDEIGKPLGEGISNGLAAVMGSPSLSNVISSAFIILLNNIRTWWGIASPSTKMHDEVGLHLGQGLTDGFVQGIKDHVADVITAFTDLISSIFSKETLASITQKAKDLGKSIIDGIVYAFQHPGDTVKNAFSGLIDGIFGAGEEEAEIRSPSKRAKRDIGDQITAGIAQGLTLDTILSSVTGFIGSIVTTFVGMVVSVVSSVAGLSLTLFTAFRTLSTNLTTTTLVMTDSIDQDFVAMQQSEQATVETLLTVTTDLFTLLKTDTVTIVSSIKQAVIDIFEEMQAGAENATERLKESVLSILNELLSTIQVDFVEEGENVGEDFISGIIRGIENKIEAVKRAAESAVNAAVDAAKEAAESNSPSKKAAREVGAPIAEGVAVGINDQVSAVIKAASRMTDNIFNSLNTQIGGRLGQASTSSVVTNNSTKIFNLSVNSTQSRGNVIRDFGVMQVMAG